MTQTIRSHPHPQGRPPPPPSQPSPWPHVERRTRVEWAWRHLVLWAMVAAVWCCGRGAGVTNEETVRFSRPQYNASVPENALGNTPVVSDDMMGVRITDPSLRIRYRITEGDPNNFFRATARVVGDFCFLELSVRTGNQHVLNRESDDLYKLKVKAQHRRHDRTKEDLPGAVSEVWVTITDLNDLSPFFLQDEYRVRLSEDTALHTSVTRVKAEDPDAGLNGQIYYSFKEDTSVFAIHPTSGVVTLTRPLRFLEQAKYQLTVQAQDRGLRQRGGWPAQARLFINVTEENVYDPQIIVTKLPEARPRAHLAIVAIINVVDQDRGPSGEVRSLEIVEGDPDRVFRVLPGSGGNEFNLAALDTIDWSDTPLGFNLTLKATDGGTRPRFSYKVVRVAAPPAPEEEAVFTQEEYETEVSEIAPLGTYVLQVGAWMPGTQRRVKFAILAGNRGGQFNIDPTSGVITTASVLDAETRDAYTLTVGATTTSLLTSQRQAAAKVIIRVKDANDNTPMIVAPQGVVRVEEHQPTGTWVTKVRAQDYDSGENGYVSYSLANADDVPFSVDHFTGEVRTTRALDYETERRTWRLRVRASDWGSPYRRQSEKIITVHVEDVNDNRPQFERIACTGHIDRHTPLGSEIFTLSAVDFDQGNIISYRIVGGNEDRCFSLDSTSGVLTLTCDLQDIMTSERVVNVTASDGQHFADTLPLRFQLVKHANHVGGVWADLQCQEMGVAQRLAEQLARAKKNNMKDDSFLLLTPPPPVVNAHAPELRNMPLEVRVRENSEPGTVVFKVDAVDQDSGYPGHLVYAIVEGNEESVFQMNMETGELTVVGLLDRERVARYTLNVTVSDLGKPQRTTTRLVTITLVDENDNAPQFDKPAYSFFLPENVANGTSVYELRAHDPDEGSNGVVTYSLATDTKDFRLDPVTGRLSVAWPLDHETHDVYELRVVATDGGARSAHAYVTVQVANINDCPPVFPSDKNHAIRIPEDLPVGALVTLVAAHDPDSPKLRYSLVSGHEGVFRIDEDTAALRLYAPLDYETRPAYNITVRASDDGTPPLSATTYVIVQVVDVDENVHMPVFGLDVVEAQVLENSPPHTLVISVPALDADLNPADAAVTYSLVGPEGRGVFYIDQKGDIYTMSWLDRETVSRYWLSVRAQDSGTVPKHATLHVYVSVEDVNDHRPLSSWPVYWPGVPENSPPDTVVVTVEATDPDPSANITYEITGGNPQSIFTIDDKTGEIRTGGRQLDREQLAEHMLEVTIHDGEDPATSLSSVAYVAVNILDENDHAPEFLESLYKFSVPILPRPPSHRDEYVEDMPIGRVVAKDHDEDDNGDISYSIEGDQWVGTFKIDPKTGIISARSSLNPQEDYEFTVQAMDNGRPPNASSCLVVIDVVPVPEDSKNPPVILEEAEARVTVLESDPVGQHVTLINAMDEDGDRVWFDILAGDDDHKFTIGRDTGSIILARPLDAEKKSLYNLTIGVTDGVYTVTSQVIVSVLDVNDNRPAFSEPTYEVEVGENTAPGTTIFTLTASDPDSDKHLTFTLVNTAHVASASKFMVNPESGDIVLYEPLDREVQELHVLTVCVKDRIIPIKSDYARVTIRVRDYNDHAPQFLATLYNGTVTETAAVGTAITEVVAVDRDKGVNGDITYSIISGNIGGVFSLHPSTGIISLVRTVDRQEMPEYWLAVRGSDNGSPPKHSHVNVNIHVRIAHGAPPRFLKKEYVFEVSENGHVGDFLGIVEVETRLGVVFSLNVDSRRIPFAINPSTGIISLDAPLDYEKTQSYNYTVFASSMNGQEATAQLVINVLDENDNSPYFTQSKYVGHISEAAAVNSVVLMEDNTPLVISAKDKDSDQNANLVFTILEEEARKYFAIDSSTGAIRTVGPLDHEVVSKVTFSVKVHDSGHPRLCASTTASVTITITDINDVPPRFLLQEYNASLLIPTHVGVAVVQLNATDLDFDGKANLEYEIADGNKHGKFKINSKTGLITVNNSKNLVGTYRLKVTVNDGQFAYSTTANIHVEQIPNTGLRFSEDKYFAAVEENSTRVDKVVMVHVLGSELNEHLKFSILNPTDMFEIGETSGVIQTRGKPFDREVQDNYLLIIEVRSVIPSVPARVAHVQVHVVVTDKNDNAPIFVNKPYYGVISVDAKKNQVVFRVHATDFDADENRDVRYELQRGNGELFSVGRSTGEIILKQTLEGLKSEYELIISAYDGGSPPLSSQVPVRLKVVDRAQPIFDRQFYSATVAEDADAHTPIVTVVAHSQLNRKLIYTIVGGNEHQTFAMEHEEGLIRVQDDLDFETQNNYQLTVRATDSYSGKWAEVVVSVQVIDVNDNPPEFIQHFYNVTVSEATAIATPILTITTTDQDTGPNAGVTYRLMGLNGTLPDHFYMEGDSGVLILKQGLDRETAPVHHFLVQAIDKGTPPLSSTAHILVTVVDMNDNPPVFEQQAQRCVVTEDASRGHFVTLVSASDEDISDVDKLTYSIVDGNDMQAFVIDSTTGIVTVWNNQKLQESYQHILNISVTDGVFTAYSRLVVTISPVNAHSPTFRVAQYNAHIQENVIRSTVAQVSARDGDSGRYGDVTYHFIGDKAHNFFRINENTGEVWTSKVFDREERDEYSFTVMAMDIGGRTGFTTLHITVDDENDNKPVFMQSDYKAIIRSNTTAGTVVLRVLAEDPDKGENGTVSYQFHMSTLPDTMEAFSIDSTTGEIILKKNAKELGSSVFEFFVEGRDTGRKSLHSNVAVLLRIVDADVKPPEFLSRIYALTVSENTQPGTRIGDVAARYDGELQYVIDWGGHEVSPPVSVSPQGTLTLTSLVDHEDMQRLTLIVTAVPIDEPELAASTTVVIEVQDINDESPVFESETYYVSVAENTPSGSNVVKVFANDKDTGSNSEVRYTLEEQSPLLEEPLFTLDPYSGWLSLNQELDAETKSKYELKVIAKDNGNPQRNSTATIMIDVIDYNDNPPRFVKEEYRAPVREDSLPGTVVVQMEVQDYDLGGGALDGEVDQGIVYYLTAGNALQHFHVRSGGQIYVAKKLDREVVDQYALEVTATDGVFVAKAWVFIEVLDVNDNGPMCTTPLYRHTVSEAALPGTYLLRVSATDKDLTSQPQFFITGQGAGMFSMEQESGQLSIAKQLDRETQSQFSLIATVKDGSNEDWKCTCHIEIEITDMNDNAPVFSMPSYSVNVPENSPENLLLLKVHAADPDKGINRKVTYALEGNDIFTIDRQTGILSVTQSLDREKQAMYNLTVIAMDHGTPQLSARTNILVLVSDVNDNPPEFASHTYYTIVTESASIGSDIVRVLATSRDSGKNAEITYSIIGGNEHRKFAINPKTGVVTVLDPLDFERAHNYQLTVQATDGGEPPLSNHATVNVTITDINDNAPIFLQNSYSAIVNEAALSGERLIQVVATDLDSGTNGKISYAIANGDPKKQFYIDPESGHVSVAGPLDRETVSSYNLEVIALDHGIPQRSGSVMLNIEVRDANDNPPVFVETNHTAYVQEDKPVGHLVFKFDIIDADDEGSGNGRPFTFEIRNGNENNAFRMTQDGHLRTATKFNHMVKAHYHLLIRVYDNGSPPLYAETWIDIKIIEESRYHPVVFPLYVTVFVHTGDYFGGVLGKIKAADEDPYDTLTYSIASNQYDGNSRYFAIDPRNGTLSAVGGLDEGSYTVNISVTDGKFTTISQAEADVINISDQMVENAVIVQLGGASAEEFLLSYKRSFHRGIKNLLNVKSRDVIILSLQNAHSRMRREGKKKLASKGGYKESADLDVLFTVRKSGSSYYPRNLVRKKVSAGQQTLESVLGLTVIGVLEDECTENTCENGECQEQVVLDDSQVAIVTDTKSFVSLHHRHESKCICPIGFSGARCDIVINECAHSPCPSYKMCVPDSSRLGYSCLCPEGFVGVKCNLNKTSCIGRDTNPECYSPVSPLSYRGKSYTQYTLRVTIERHFSFSLWFRTRHPSGNLMFTAGRIDYSILEIEGGEVRYRWDLGSGEGLVTVASVPVDDGQWHHVSLERFGNTAEIIVDGQHRGQGASPGSSDLLNLETQHLYLGAEVRPWAGAQDPRKGMVGCIDDPRVDDTPLPLTHQATSKVASLTRLAHVVQHCQGELQPPGVCGAHPCLNGGTCEERGASFICQCHPRFQGSRCEIDSNPCASSPCLNNGHCVNLENTYRCECPARVSGPRCQYMHCIPNPCLNRGTCEEGISGPICKCHGFTGAYCNIDINECAKNPCLNGGSCINTYGSFRCMCPGNATGTYCNANRSTLIDIGMEEIIYIVIGVVSVIILGLIIVLAMHCRERRAARRRQLIEQTNHVILKPKNTDNHNIYKRNSKMSNLEASQNPHGCTPRPDSYPTSPSEPAYMPLNNFDTIRSYGSAGDELENLPQYSRDFVQNISKPNSLHHHHLHTPQINPLGTPRGSTLGSTVGSTLGSPASTLAADTDSLHKPWKDALAHNLKDTYYENAKIQNDVKFRQGEYMSLKKLSVDGSTRDDASVRSGASVDDIPGYHWDCSDWARPSQNPLPNIMEVPGGEVRDSSSYHSNESNESIVVKPAENQPLMPPVEGPVDPGRDMETLPADELVSECGTEFELESRPDLDTSQLLDPNSDAGAESDTSLFIPQPQRYETHPNQYLPRYQVGSETETDDERGKLLNTLDDPYSVVYRPPPINHLPEDRDGATYSPYRIRSNRRHDTVKRFSEFGADISVISGMEDEEEGASLWGGAASNTSASDLDNVCDIEDSEVNSEFENDEKMKK